MKNFLAATTLILLTTSAYTLTEPECTTTTAQSASLETALNTSTITPIITPIAVVPSMINSTNRSDLTHDEAPTPHTMVLSSDLSKRIRSSLPKNISPEALLQEGAEATTDLKKFVKAHPVFSGAVGISLMGTKRSGACVRFMIRQPLLLTLAAVATIGAEKTVSYLEKGYYAVQPLIAHAQKIYADAAQQADTLETEA